jgi:hypothetical protein
MMKSYQKKTSRNSSVLFRIAIDCRHPTQVRHSFFTRSIERKCQDIIIAVFSRDDRKSPRALPSLIRPGTNLVLERVLVVHACSDDIDSRCICVEMPTQ